MENTVAKKIENLVKLQSVDSKLDEIKKIRGDLPEEVQDLEDEIAGYQTRLDKNQADLKALEQHIFENKENIKEAKKLIAKYEDQQQNVRNNREYDAITKEMELQDLEIQIFNKKIREYEEQIGHKKTMIEDVNRVLEDRKRDLDVKKKELDNIVEETEVEEEKLKKDREKVVKSIEERLVKSYDRIRKNVRNGLAVVDVKRGACGGCFNMVPPQRQADIREKKKLIVCEHCGRIFADVVIVEVEEEKKPKKTSRRKKAASK